MEASHLSSSKKFLLHYPGQEVLAHNPFNNEAGHRFPNLPFLPQLQEEFQSLKNVIESFYGSDSSIEVRNLIEELLSDTHRRDELVNTCYRAGRFDLLTKQKLQVLKGKQLVDALFTGMLPGEEKKRFTALDGLVGIGKIFVSIEKALVLGNTFSRSIGNELMESLFSYHPFFKDFRRTLDVGNIAPKLSKAGSGLDLTGVFQLGNHLLVGHKEKSATHLFPNMAKKLFDDLALESIVEVRLPQNPDIRNLRSLISQISDHEFLAYTSLLFDGRKVAVKQYLPDGKQIPRKNLRECILEIDPRAGFVQCADGVTSQEFNEQWTFACDTLVLKPGVLLMYDRNPDTLKALIKKGYRFISEKNFLAKVQSGEITTSKLAATVITMPCAELYRFAGGLSDLVVKLN